MVGKYAIFSFIKDNKPGGFIEGYVHSVNLIKEIYSFKVKMKGLFRRTYILDILSEVHVYKKKPKTIISDIDTHLEKRYGMNKKKFKK